MCGITGIFAFNLVGKFNRIHVTNATMALHQRGPDFQDIYTDEWIGLGHRRLSIIDTRAVANQPMWDESNRYCIVFNGEIFNYKQLRASLESKGEKFNTTSDTEVLLKLLMHEGTESLNELNGFFAFAFYDKQEQTMIVARDRYGVKPLLYVFDDDKFLFASEMKAILQYGLEKQIDYNSLYTYLQLNYIPAPDTIFTHVKKLLPGHYLEIRRQKMSVHQYYSIPYSPGNYQNISYSEAQSTFERLMDEAVQRRLVSDVPLGAFLSGGLDSSVITALASKHKPDLHTFSIGFRDEKFFDETHYAELVAKKFNTKHTVFSLTNDDLYRHVHDILNYIDEPFADSSAIAVYILSKETRKHATVALSGDGADELLAGYNKHAAHYRVLHPGLKEKLVQSTASLWGSLPQSRNSAFGNKIRQLSRFAEGAKQNSKDRYWQWAALASNDDALKLLHPDLRQNKWLGEYVGRRKQILQHIPSHENINDILYTDVQLVLANDMLTKVDLMSMANGLEVRTPFLDVEVVNFLFSLPESYKINRAIRKRILQDTFRNVLPTALYNRPKKGFEVPLLKWFRREMKTYITEDLLGEKFIQDQGLFDIAEISKLKLQLFSANPADSHARIWALVVFQAWWRKYVG
ncbi:asparagine synthase (glutamine-hydrolyzing) [Pseudochryseolinea flava]|uniref:asparagine synthase (glutamine-hydrolyzing) n=1 Tax=Pseudochryseolinea flava TaxID=2059302 RepID=A0A364Y3P5_9BACT|nr:asparagine synthase (glutamine-hydrolyzing) [Pseudochryseolinea flava]RAW00776.1 asparagine synthase (glutamine-hydrolyzing) [Pseudochryseolinea flava]